jgi:hypothetical protein
MLTKNLEMERFKGNYLQRIRSQGYLISELLAVLPLAFLLTGGVINTDARGDESIRELKDIDPPPLQLDLRLAGIAHVDGESSWAVIVDNETGDEKIYRLGESIKGAEIVEIASGSSCLVNATVVLEKDGRKQFLSLKGDGHTDGGPTETLSVGGTPATEEPVDITIFKKVISEKEDLEDDGPPEIEGGGLPPMGMPVELPPFNQDFSETGPIPGEGTPVKELPAFEPITNTTGPPVPSGYEHKKLPEFTPVVIEGGPGGVGR